MQKAVQNLTEDTLWTEDVSMEKNARKVEKSWFPSSDERRNVTQLV